MSVLQNSRVCTLEWQGSLWPCLLPYASKDLLGTLKQRNWKLPVWPSIWPFRWVLESYLYWCEGLPQSSAVPGYGKVLCFLGFLHVCRLFWVGTGNTTVTDIVPFHAGCPPGNSYRYQKIHGAVRSTLTGKAEVLGEGVSGGPNFGGWREVLHVQSWTRWT